MYWLLKVEGLIVLFVYCNSGYCFLVESYDYFDLCGRKIDGGKSGFEEVLVYIVIGFFEI